MKTTMIFDLDGLLIDSEIISYRLYQDLLNEHGHPFTVEEYARNYSGKTGVGNMETMIRIYDLPITLEEGLDFAEKREAAYFEKGVDLKPGAESLLQYLKDKSYKIILATSSTRDRALGVLDQNGIRAYFDEMVFGTEVKRGKPNPDIFLKACEKAGEIPENCLVLEDSEAGVQAGHAAGMDVICVPDMKMPGEEFQKMAAEILDSLEQVIPWLEGREMEGRD
ncbi:MAG: HAD family phosphatase [Hungatella sp.]|nr:HAD family phosphatase [Hungatella sp.]